MKSITFALMAILSAGALAGEADHYSLRSEPLQDISTLVNEAANHSLREAVEKTNRQIECDSSSESELALYENMTAYFANHSKGKIVIDILHSEDFPKRMIPLKTSVYGKWSILNGYLMGRASAANSPLALTPLIRIGEEVVGTDKLEHMFGMGLIYFKRHHMQGKLLRRTLKQGIFREKTALGGNILATGVFAYSDLSANFNGMRFWNHILQKRDDVLGKQKNIGPYVKCNAGKFEVVENNPIDFRNYIDASMDESINCSKFATKSGARKFLASLKRLSEKTGTQMKCPMNMEKFNQMKNKYNVPTIGDKKGRPLYHWILNEEGTEDVSYTREFWGHTDE